MPGTFDAVLYGTELASARSGLRTARYIKDPSSLSLAFTGVNFERRPLEKARR